MPWRLLPRVGIMKLLASLAAFEAGDYLRRSSFSHPESAEERSDSSSGRGDS